MSYVRLADIPAISDSIVDGKGLRYVLFFQGCDNLCKSVCHNPETHSLTGGKVFRIADVKKMIKENTEISAGATFSGGEPFLQPLALYELAKYTHSLGLNVWAYTGKHFEDLIEDKLTRKTLTEIDILVDGPFILSKKDLTLRFRGSSNQRIIDVKRSLSANKAIVANLEDTYKIAI